MPGPLELTDEYVYRIAPDGKSTKAALQLLDRNAFRNARMSEDGTRLEALCQGRDPRPYAVRVDLEDPERPRVGCTCVSPKHPCKHALGLLFLVVRSPETFAGSAAGGSGRKRKQPAMLDTVARKAPAEERGTPADVGEALYQDVLAHPEDEAPRLIFADWLEENGQADRAEFIRVQMELARATEAGREKELRRREKELWQAHRDEWLQSVPPHLRKRKIEFQRGFLEELHLPPELWAKHGPALFGRHPIYRIRLTGTIGTGEVGKLVVIPALARVRVLSLDGCTLQEPLKTLELLLSSPFLSGLTRLNLRNCGLSTPVLGALTANSLLGRLRDLDLTGNGIGPKGVQGLAESPHVAGLRELSLVDNPIGEAGARALAASPHLGSIELLDLRGVAISEGVKEMLRTRFGDRVLLD
jgi:uncharacterized protein (TIGR02996 family)